MRHQLRHAAPRLRTVLSGPAAAWAWGHFALPKKPLEMGMGTLCTVKKPPIYGRVDAWHCQKAPYIWAWGHIALPKRPLYMGMGTHHPLFVRFALCTGV